MDVKAKQKTEEYYKNKIQVILKNHVGRENPITVAAIADHLDGDDGGTNPLTRARIKEVIQKSRLPIGSCNRGYYVINSLRELNQHCRELTIRIVGIKQRIRFVRRAYLRRKK